MLDLSRVKVNKKLLAVFIVIFCLASLAFGQAQANSLESSLGVKLDSVSDPGVSDQFIAGIEKGGELYGAMLKIKYGLKLEKTIRIVITANQKGYQAANIRYRGITSQQAAQVRSNGISIKNDTILLNGGSSVFRAEAGIVRLVGHELTHKLQVQLSGGKTSARDYIWLREGSANLFGAESAEFGGLSTFESYVDKQLKTVIKTGKVPPLEELTNKKGWNKAKSDKLNPYQNATIMLKYLSDNYGGPEKILQYWVAYGKMNREAAFKQTFGITHDQFLTEFKTYYQNLLGGNIAVILREVA